MNFFSRKQSSSRFSLIRLMFSFGLPLVLLLAFLGRQFLNFNDIGLSNGFSHPLSGWDHLVTMLAVGIWAAQLRGKAIWMLPLAFVGVMSLGGLAGASGLEIPNVDGIILISCAVFSVLITRNIRFSNKINVLIVAFFAFFHGFAHGQEISTSASLISYTLGFMLATLLLHGAGILVAKLVVFAITCLLTILFSSSALAKSAESVIDIKDNNSVINHLQDNTLNFGYVWLSPQQQSYESGCLDFDGNHVKPKNLNKKDTDGGGRGLVGARTLSTQLPNTTDRQNISHQGKYNVGGNYHVLTVKHDLLNACANAINQFFYPSYSSDCSNLDFKNYFPKINHTPGRHFLSNGVGLTSPPLLFTTDLAPHSSLALRNTPNISSEVQFLRLNPQKIYSGNPYTKTCKSFRRSCALNIFKAKVLAAPKRNNFAISTFNAGFTSDLSLAANANSVFHLFNASSSFADNRINHQACKAFHPPNKKIKINEIA